ncbi:PEFG-CTERM sorting domain-containing protein [Nitrosopumilus ureiphilus]|uniref:PEFG-CTERM domain-containing protein n=1 Tax=Nitrosopumilus ureiphilus TaxID=1470067 RepID=A0A7D5REQ8_9ARCH|nr:PEFG-CTERM sorting domain-containing protein [Nitrosopumilus ureiphilus]QLH07263.1 PEFG-CTERM domain-containing protein [Nitrosopumilus ureiphilus]
MIRYVFVFLLLLIIPSSSHAFAEHIFNSDAYAQYLDISQLESEKVTFEYDEKSYDVYYGYHGSFDAMGSDDPIPVLSSMKINEERKSIEIIMDDVPEKTDFWVRAPTDVISAKGEKFTVLVDGVDTRYDLMKFPNDYVVGFIISEDTKNIEIIGTRVIPEFEGLSILILGIPIMAIIYVAQKNPLVRDWTRIN